MTLSDMAEILGCDTPIDSDAAVQRISTDTRHLASGDAFIAIRGEQFDGHEFIPAAKQAGASVAIVEEDGSYDLPTLKVKNTREAYGQLARAHRRQFSIPVIGITGSCGKTSVKEMTAAILRQAGKVLATQANYNNDIGVPQTLLQLSADHDYAVIEVGTSQPGEIAFCAQWIEPTIALINNVAPAHIEALRDEQGVAKEKGALYQALSPHGTAIINLDEPFSSMWLPTLPCEHVISYAIEKEAMVSAGAITLQPSMQTQFDLHTPSGSITISLPLIGHHHVHNALAAASIALACDVSLEDIQAGLASLEPVSGRMHARVGQAQSRIIDDSYNANPGSMTAALDALSQFPGTRIFVMGDMGELGEKAEHYHRQVGQAAKKKGIDKLFCCGEMSAQACKAFGINGQHFRNQADLIAALLPELNADVTCLVKGSRSAAMENIVNAILA